MGVSGERGFSAAVRSAAPSALVATLRDFDDATVTFAKLVADPQPEYGCRFERRWRIDEARL